LPGGGGVRAAGFRDRARFYAAFSGKEALAWLPVNIVNLSPFFPN
jgi:hypothetical protein